MILKNNVFTPYHYSSENCMNFVKKYMKKGDSVLDIGTGTGILAIKCKERGAGRVLATDIQPEAVENAKENAKYYGVDIEVKQNYLNWDINEKFDLTIANLYANPAIEFLQYAANTMTEDGILILTWYSKISYFHIEEYFEIIDQTEGFEYNTYVLKQKRRIK